MTQISELLGGKINHIGRTCDLIMIGFDFPDKELGLHVQKALFRVSAPEKLLICSGDMWTPGDNYQKKLFKKFQWDNPGDSLFDEQVEKYEEMLLGATVDSASQSAKDLIIKLNNGLSIEVLADTLVPEHEVYRLFQRNDLESHYVVET